MCPDIQKERFEKNQQLGIMVLTDFERGQVIGGYLIYQQLEKGNQLILDYSSLTEFAYSTVKRLVGQWEEQGNVDRKISSGRPKSITPKQSKKLVEVLRKNPTLSIPQLMQKKAIQDMEIETCTKTVLNTVKELGFERVRKKRSHFISEQNIVKRQDWCKQRENQTQQDFNQILFSDESYLYHDYYRTDFIWKKESHLWNSKMIEYQKQFPKKVLVWALISHVGGIAFKKLDGSLTADSYIEEILEDAIANDDMLKNDGYIFQQDNARVHSAKKTQNWFQKNQIEVLQWPAQSLDINIIEQVWWFIKMRINNKIHSNTDEEKIFKHAEEVFFINEFSDFIQNLYLSLPSRIQSILSVLGKQLLLAKLNKPNEMRAE